MEENKLTQEQKNLLADRIAVLHKEIEKLKQDAKDEAIAYRGLIKDKTLRMQKAVTCMLQNRLMYEDIQAWIQQLELEKDMSLKLKNDVEISEPSL